MGDGCRGDRLGCATKSLANQPNYYLENAQLKYCGNFTKNRLVDDSSYGVTLKNDLLFVQTLIAEAQRRNNTPFSLQSEIEKNQVLIENGRHENIGQKCSIRQKNKTVFEHDFPIQAVL